LSITPENMQQEEGAQGLKVAIDSWVLSSRLRRQGTYVYAQNLITQFKKLAKVEPEISFCVFASQRAANDANGIEGDTRFELAPTRLLAREGLWRLGGADLASARAGSDLMFCPTASAIPLGSVPVISTIHDVTPLTMPSHGPRVNQLVRWLMWWVAKLSRAIITVSERSKSDLIEAYGLPETQVHVVYNGCNHELFNDAAPDAELMRKLRRMIGLDRPYILHHGTIQPRKNLERLIAAYRLMLLRNKNLDLDLVLAGDLGWEYDRIIAAAKRPGPGRVILAGALADSELARLIQGAELAVMPSLYEGFCLPMVECMACGTPTIAANSSCLPEVSGGRLLYFDPFSVDDIANCMERGLEDTVLRRDLIHGGKQRAGDFDWAKCARQTLDVFRQYAQNGNHQ